MTTEPTTIERSASAGIGSRTIAVLTGKGYKSTIIEEEDGRVHFNANLDIDADGAYRAYHPDNKSGLDDLRNAHQGNNWFGCVSISGKQVIQSLDDLAIQGPDDPAPGFYVSATSLQLLQPDGKPYPRTNPRGYVDAESVPFIVVPPAIIRGVDGVVLGCQAKITDTRNGKSVDCVVADIGPRTKTGEASIAAAKALGVPSSARKGGESKPVFTYELWPGVAAVVNGVTYPLQQTSSSRSIPDDDEDQEPQPGFRLADLVVSRQRAVQVQEVSDTRGGEPVSASGDTATGAFVTPQSVLSFPVATTVVVALTKLTEHFKPGINSGYHVTIGAAVLVGLLILLITLGDEKARPKDAREWLITLIMATINTAFLAGSACGLSLFGETALDGSGPPQS